MFTHISFMDKVISNITTATPKIWHLQNKSLHIGTKKDWTEGGLHYYLKNNINRYRQRTSEYVGFKKNIEIY